MRRGIPHFIHDYRASEDVFTRVLPVLLFVVLFEIVGATNLHWSWWQNTLALIGGAAVITGAWALINRARGRPWSQRPDEVGSVELGAFVALPALLPLIFGGQVSAALAVAGTNLLILGLVYVVASYGILPMIRWALGQTLRQIGTVADLFGRALPLLLLITVTLFLNSAVWQVAAALPNALFAVVVGLFVLLGTAFLSLRLPKELDRLGEQTADEALVSGCADTPVASLALGVVEAGVAAPKPLTRRQQGNVLLVLFFSQAVQVLLVTLSIGLFIFVLGLVAIRPEVVASWLGDTDPRVLAEWQLFGSELHVTRALVLVSGLLASLSGFYFTVYVITDATYREEFFTSVVGEVRQSLAVRNVYLALIDRQRDR